METRTRLAIRLNLASTWQQVSVPEQVPTRLIDAHETARILRGTLANFDALSMHPEELQKAWDGKYNLAVDSKGLLEQGWYQIERDAANNTITFTQIGEQYAHIQVRNLRPYEILHVTESAIDSASKALPISLQTSYFGMGRTYFTAHGLSSIDACVALVPIAKLDEAKALALSLRSELNKLQVRRIPDYASTLAQARRLSERLNETLSNLE